jgi:hypothetical protein
MGIGTEIINRIIIIKPVFVPMIRKMFTKNI